MKSIKITLGGQEYDVPLLTFGDIEELTMAAQQGRQKPFDSLRLAMSRATPAVADIGALQVTFAEINAANVALARGSGVAREDRGEAQPKAPAA